MLVDRRLKILHIIDSGGLYGAERVLLGLSAKCQDWGYDVTIGTIVAPRDEDDALGQAAQERGIPHHAFVMADGLSLQGLRALMCYVRDHSIDVIHSHGYKANILLALAPGRRRMICTLHGWTAAGRLSKLALYETLSKPLLRRFDRVVAVSQQMRPELGRYVSSRRLHVIHNGIELPEYPLDSSAVPERRGVSVPMRALAIGRLSSEKAFNRLIEATRILQARGTHLHVTIAGEGDARKELERQISLSHLGEHVRLLGYVTDVDALYAQADFFVLCSSTEGLPLVLLEAMSRQIPVIATPVGEIPFVLGGGLYGYVLADENPLTLADGIGKLIASYKDAALRAVRASDHVRENYSIDAMTRRYCELYQDCMQ